MDDHGASRISLCYRPLNPEFIRVFELEAGNPSEPIVGRLVSQAIDGEAYEAVSYVWGDPRKRREITVDGTTFSITANLHGALMAFRNFPFSWSPDESDPDTRLVQQPVRRLWADAVCINQEDLPERTSQVELMGRIFASAHRVLAWLGWEEGETGRQHTLDAIRFIHSFMEDPDAGLRDARVLLLHHDVASPAEHLAHLSDDEQRRLFEIEYFHRAWIVQELGLAREAILYAALKPSDEAEAAGDASRRESTDRKDHALVLDSIDWPLVGRFVEFLDYKGASVVTHLGLLCWVAHHIVMVWEMKEDGTPDCDFLTGMHWTRILHVTDPRDRVYSLLGHPLAVLDGEFVVKPDYTSIRSQHSVDRSSVKAKGVGSSQAIGAAAINGHVELMQREGEYMRTLRNLRTLENRDYKSRPQTRQASFSRSYTRRLVTSALYGLDCGFNIKFSIFNLILIKCMKRLE